MISFFYLLYDRLPSMTLQAERTLNAKMPLFKANGVINIGSI